MVFKLREIKRYLRNKVGDAFWNAPTRLIPFLVQVRFTRTFNERIKLTRVGELLKLTEFDSFGKEKDVIHFYHARRTTRYFDGISNRLEILLEEYCLNQIPDLKSGVFIDIGSNVGEFSLGLSKIYPDSKFIRFEPSREENLASKINMSSTDDTLIAKALWSEITELNFYRRNEHGDSSLFTPDNQENSIRIETTTLDHEIRLIQLGAIELIKLEAEGAEPEILLGGEMTLKRCRYVTADLGPERGVLQESTFDEAHTILSSYGFSLVGRNIGGRKCYLFKNDTLVSH